MKGGTVRHCKRVQNRYLVRIVFSAHVQHVIDGVDGLRDTVDDHWQIPRDEALLLTQLVRLGRCRSICEIGTSYGFSTLHLAAVAEEIGGHVHAFEIDPRKLEHTQRHLRAAGLMERVTLHAGDARETLRHVEPGKPFDFVFIDAVKSQCGEYLDAVWRRLAPHCAIVTDNTDTHADELASFVERLRRHPELTSCHVSVGNGLELSLRGA